MIHSLSQCRKAVAAALITAATCGTALAQQMTASVWMPPSHLVNQAMMKWTAQVESATQGRVSFRLLPRPAASPAGTLDAVRNGVVDLSYTVHGYMPGRFTLTTLAELPFLGDTSEAVSVAYQRIYEKHLAQADEHRGVKVLTVFTHGPGSIYNVKRPVAALKDVEGLKFRVGGGMANEVAKAIGVNATVKPAPESYELLSTGVMDGVFLPAESIEAYKLDGLIKHVTMFPGGLYNTSFVMMMNEQKWKALSEADRETLTKLSGEPLARALGKAWDEADRRGLAYMQAANVTVTKASPQLIKEVQDRTAVLEQRWLQAAQAKGVANPAAVLMEFRALTSKP